MLYFGTFIKRHKLLTLVLLCNLIPYFLQNWFPGVIVDFSKIYFMFFGSGVNKEEICTHSNISAHVSNLLKNFLVEGFEGVAREEKAENSIPDPWEFLL